MTQFLRAPLLALLLLCAACGTSRNWQEVHTVPMRFAQVWEGVDFVARTDGFLPDPAESDRGLGVYQTRWRRQTLMLGRAGRYRLRAEIRAKEEPEGAWLVRYYIEQQKVDDLARMFTQTEDDWSAAGQFSAREQIFGERLSRRLGTGPDYSPER